MALYVDVVCLLGLSVNHGFTITVNTTIFAVCCDLPLWSVESINFQN